MRIKENAAHLVGFYHLRMFIRKIFKPPGWDPGKIK